MNKVKVIAELGVNHNGQEELAFELIDKAVESGADIVKFQTFNSYKLASGDAKKASYQEANTDIDNSQLEMLKGLELSRECFSKLKRYSDEKNIGFLSSAFDKESLDFVVNKLFGADSKFVIENLKQVQIDNFLVFIKMKKIIWDLL